MKNFFRFFFQKKFLAEAMQDEESFIRVSEIDESDDVKRSQTIEAAVAKVRNQIFIFFQNFLPSYKLIWFKLLYQNFTANISVKEG